MLKTVPASWTRTRAVALAELADPVDRGLDHLRRPEHADVVHHEGREVRLDRGRALALATASERLDLGADGVRRIGRDVGHARPAAVGGHLAPGASSEDEQVDERVGAQAVGAVDRDAGGLAGREEALDDRVLLVADDPSPEVCRDPAHRVVGRRLDRHRLRERLDPEVDPGELGDVGQLLLDHLAPEMAHVQEEVVALGTGAAAVADLEVHGAADHVARRELHQGRGVVRHETLAGLVEERAALAAGRLGQQDSHPVDARRMELVELHVLERAAHGGRSAPSRRRSGTGRSR